MTHHGSGSGTLLATWQTDPPLELLQDSLCALMSKVAGAWVESPELYQLMQVSAYEPLKTFRLEIETQLPQSWGCQGQRSLSAEREGPQRRSSSWAGHLLENSASLNARACDPLRDVPPYTNSPY